MILGLLTPTAGHTKLFGFDTRTHRAEALARTGATLEGQSYFPHLSAVDNLKVWARVSGVADERIPVVVQQVGMAARSGDKVRTYSLGMKQRLAVAAALLTDPELVILDEPTNGLDPAGIREFRQLVRDLAAAGKTVFVSSHILSEVEQMCDDVGIVKAGHLIVEQPVSSLRKEGSAVEVRTTDDAGALQVLRALPWVKGVTQPDSRIVVEADVHRAADISRALAEAGIYLSELRAQETTLEDFFLEVTGEGGTAVA
jgi:ABC-2 type transport system ATP-binding protein